MWNYHDLIKRAPETCYIKQKPQQQFINLHLELTHHEDDSEFTESLLKCANFVAIMNYYGPWVSFSSNQYFAPIFAQNAFTSTHLQDLFPDGIMFTHLNRFLFHPIAELQAQIDAFAQRHHLVDPAVGLGTNDHLYAIQIRRNEKELNGNWFKESEEPFFYNCFVQHVVHKDDQQHTLEDYKILVLSDNSTVREHAQRHFGAEHVLYYEHAVLNFERDVRAIKSALIDAWIMSFASGFVVSRFSTFGNLGHGRANVVPFIVTRYPDGSLGCAKSDWKSEPEYHWGFRLANYACPSWQGGKKGFPGKR